MLKNHLIVALTDELPARYNFVLLARILSRFEHTQYLLTYLYNINSIGR